MFAKFGFYSATKAKPNQSLQGIELHMENKLEFNDAMNLQITLLELTCSFDESFKSPIF